MPHLARQAPRAELIGRLAVCLASAVILGLCVALPATGAAFAVAVTAGCLSAAGCDTPTVVDAIVPTAAALSWIAATIHIGAQQIRRTYTTVNSPDPKEMDV